MEFLVCDRCKAEVEIWPLETQQYRSVNLHELRCRVGVPEFRA
jgi:hypothetical protein